jgi:LCP family protein required for cell wall assembly
MTTANRLDDGQFGPLLRGGRVRKGGVDWRRLGLLAVACLGIFSLTVTVSAGAIILYGAQSIERLDLPDLVAPGDTDGDGEIDMEEITDVLNVLLVGSDSRDGLSDEQLLALGTEPEAGLRTDTIMLLQLDPRRDSVAVLSFPRDLLVTRCDGTRGRINAAVGIGESTGVGGATCLIRTVTDFTGIPINHFIQVDFAGFIDMVDALGGVTLYLDEPIRDVYAGADFPAGCITMTGTDALSFVRVRRIDSDFGRIARQQRFIREVVNEAASVGTLVNVPKLLSLVDAGARAVEADRQLSLNQMRRIAFSLRGIDAGALDTRTVPATPRTINGAAFVVADEEPAEALFAAFRDANVIPAELGTEEPQAVSLADVPALTVLNGVGVAGLAAKAQQALEDAGFDVAETGNADSYDFPRTQVVYPAGLLEEAELLADALGGAVLIPGAEDDDMTIVLGEDFDPDRIEPAAGATEAPDGEDADGAAPAPAAPTPSPTPSFVGAEPGGDC